MIHILEHCALDTLKLLPLLFLSYLLVEYAEHRMTGKTREMIFQAGKAGPVIGALAGMIPQCGFSAAAAGLFAGGVISPGTLLAVFLSTSDEMLPILLSEDFTGNPEILLIKAVAGGGIRGSGGGAGKKKDGTRTLPSVRAQPLSLPGRKILRPALYHTCSAVFLFLINLVLGAGWNGWRIPGDSGITETAFLQEALCALVGMIPNCAASVLITQLYLEGVIHAGALFAGLLCGAGSGLLVLFRTNRNLRQNLILLALLYGIGLGAGFLIGCAKVL